MIRHNITILRKRSFVIVTVLGQDLKKPVGDNKRHEESLNYARIIWDEKGICKASLFSREIKCVEDQNTETKDPLPHTIMWFYNGKLKQIHYLL